MTFFDENRAVFAILKEDLESYIIYCLAHYYQACKGEDAFNSVSNSNDLKNDFKFLIREIKEIEDVDYKDILSDFEPEYIFNIWKYLQINGVRPYTKWKLKHVITTKREFQDYFKKFMIERGYFDDDDEVIDHFLDLKELTDYLNTTLPVYEDPEKAYRLSTHMVRRAMNRIHDRQKKGEEWVYIWVEGKKEWYQFNSEMENEIEVALDYLTNVIDILKVMSGD